MPPIFDDAIDAWKIGRFKRKAVFVERDPGEPKGSDVEIPAVAAVVEEASAVQLKVPETPADDPNEAGMRVDLAGIGGRKP